MSARAPSGIEAPARVLVTGASGHTGSYLVRRLLDDGYRVRALTRSRARASATLGQARGLEIVEGDLSEPDGARGSMDECAALVALSHIRFAPVLIEETRRAGARRAIFVSSTRKYTRFADKPAEQVRVGEAQVFASGLATTILRPTMIFGDARDQNLERLGALARRLAVLALPGGGRNRVQPTFAPDLVEAIVSALRRATTIGRDYDLGGPEPLLYRDMVTALARAQGRRVWIVPAPVWLFAPGAWALARLWPGSPISPAVIRRFLEDKTVDISPARAELDYRPTAFDEALALKYSGSLRPGWRRG